VTVPPSPQLDAAELGERVRTLRSDVALGCRILAAEGHDDLIWGHVSARDPAGRGVWMKCSGLGFEEIEPRHVVLVTPGGDVLEGENARHSEYPIHTEIVRARADIGGVVHSHPEELRPVSHAASLFVPPAVPRFTQTSDLITTGSLGSALAAELGDHDVVLLVNHGIVTTGHDVRSAVVRAVMLERACSVQLKVRAHAGWPTWSAPAESVSKRKVLESRMPRVWDYLVRRLRDPAADPMMPER
jgi:ribulose-5-phosphate 4-epimerase/fuculose-1-phosphate aldolase